MTELAIQYVVMQDGFAFVDTLADGTSWTCLYTRGALFVNVDEGDVLTDLTDAMRGNALQFAMRESRITFPYEDSRGRIKTHTFLRNDFGLNTDLLTPADALRQQKADEERTLSIIRATAAKRRAAQAKWDAKKEAALADVDYTQHDPTPNAQQRFVGTTKAGAYVPETTREESDKLHREAVKARRDAQRGKDDTGRAVRPLADVATAREYRDTPSTKEKTTKIAKRGVAVVTSSADVAREYRD